ncbi:coiled-coil domain-containing protein [Acuticoccus sediminis]|uniref:hypothetical protein n=1 Tax=Acuticoccus sediminis TaxID=2184697 RepID=UPI001CFDD395|nr:hypothetical protein [Acuticoccus sediminis]
MRRWTYAAVAALIAMPITAAQADTRNWSGAEARPIQIAQNGGPSWGGRWQEMERELDRLKRQNEQLRAERQAQATEIRRLEARLDNRPGRPEVRDRFRTQREHIERLEAALSAAEAERGRALHQADADRQAAERLRDRVGVLQQEAKTLRDRSDGLAATLAERTAERDDARNLARERADQLHELQSRISARNDRVGTLEGMLAETRETLTQRESEIARFEAIMQRIRDRREDGGPMRDRVERLQARLDARERDIEALQAALARTERRPAFPER